MRVKSSLRVEIVEITKCARSGSRFAEEIADCVRY